MTINHIDQLAQWYADAEQVTKTNLPNKGDTLIYPRRTSGYIIESDGGGWTPELVRSTGETVRILARAPKPKPAWHDADYVIARADGKSRRVWGNNRLMKRWEDGVSWSHAEDLRDVTPLIEAKVTDEMVLRGLNASAGLDLPYLSSFGRDDIEDMRRSTAAALGIETE